MRPSRIACRGHACRTSQVAWERTGTLDWEIPEGEWILVRAGRRITAQTTRPAPSPGTGLGNRQVQPDAAVEHHFDAYLRRSAGADRKAPAQDDRIDHAALRQLGDEFAELDAAICFSEFKARRGYELSRFLPVFAGFVVNDHATTERFLWDVRQTAQELVIANQAERLSSWDRNTGCVWRWNPMISIRARTLNLAESPMCRWRSSGRTTERSTLTGAWSNPRRWATPTARPSSRRKSFTAEFPERWLQHPASMKSQGDWAFCAGINRIVFHRFQSQSGTDKVPGMTMGPDGGYGVHWDRTQTWWDMARAYHRYVTRCSAMLRRGLFVADVLYLAAEGAPNVFLPPPSAFPARRVSRPAGPQL